MPGVRTWTYLFGRTQFDLLQEGKFKFFSREEAKTNDKREDLAQIGKGER